MKNVFWLYLILSFLWGGAVYAQAPSDILPSDRWRQARVKINANFDLVYELASSASGGLWTDDGGGAISFAGDASVESLTAASTAYGSAPLTVRSFSGGTILQLTDGAAGSYALYLGLSDDMFISANDTTFELQGTHIEIGDHEGVENNTELIIDSGIGTFELSNGDLDLDLNDLIDGGTITATAFSGGGAALTGILPSSLAQEAASPGQVLKWTGLTWAPGTDISASGSGIAVEDGGTTIHTGPSVLDFAGTAFTLTSNDASQVTIDIASDLTVAGILTVGALTQITDGIIQYNGEDIIDLQFHTFPFGDWEIQDGSLTVSGAVAANSGNIVAYDGSFYAEKSLLVPEYGFVDQTGAGMGYGNDLLILWSSNSVAAIGADDDSVDFYLPAALGNVSASGTLDVTGTTTLHDELLLDGNNIGEVGTITATAFSGSGASLTGIGTATVVIAEFDTRYLSGGSGFDTNDPPALADGTDFSVYDLTIRNSLTIPGSATLSVATGSFQTVETTSNVTVGGLLTATGGVAIASGAGLTVSSGNVIVGGAGSFQGPVTASTFAASSGILQTLSVEPAADDTMVGATVISGVDNDGGVTQWDAVYMSPTGWQQADANAANTYPALGLATTTEVSGDPVVVVTSGIIRNDAWAWTAGDELFISTTAGGLTATAPSTSGDVIQPVAVALTDDCIMLTGNATYGEAP